MTQSGDVEQPGRTGSSSQPISLVEGGATNNSSNNSSSTLPSENFQDEEQGSLPSNEDPPAVTQGSGSLRDNPMTPTSNNGSSHRTRSTHPESLASPRGFDPSSGKVASEEQVQTMIDNIAQIAQAEKGDQVVKSPSARRSSSHRREGSRRSVSHSRRSSSHQEPPGQSRRSSSRRSSSRRRSSTSRSRPRREGSSDRRHSHHRHRSSSGRRRSSRHHHHHRSKSRHREHKHEKIVDEIPTEDIKKNARPQKKRYGMFVFLMLLLVIPALVAFYFFLYGPTEDEEKTMAPVVPTLSPTLAPTIETPSPSLSPTVTGATPAPSTTPSMIPTLAPSNNLEGPINAFLFENNIDSTNATVAVKKAVDWLIDEAYFANELVFPLNERYLQRFGILVFYFSVFADPSTEAPAPAPTDQPVAQLPDEEEDEVADIAIGRNYIAQLGEISLPNWGMRTQDECYWRGMVCDEDGMLVEINLPRRDLIGTLPKEMGLFPNLQKVDLSKNHLKGSIPDELYDNLGLKEVFLYKNKLSGTISSKIGNLWNLTHVHLSHNQLSGSIPRRMASRAQIRQIRYFNVHRNQMTGVIPPNMRLRQMFYMDLGHNKFSGQLPSELGTEYVRLRHLYLDHNEFTGTVPQSYTVAGDGRIQSLSVNDNQLTGDFPGNHQIYTQMLQLTIQNNNFDSMDKDTCKLDVFVGGELVEFKSSCDICRCGGDSLMCRNCV